MFLTRISVGHPVFATMVMVAILVFGLYSFQRLPIEQYPDIDLPVVAVVASYPGASPESVETQIVRPIESAVNSIAGIDNIQSTATSGQALVLIFFKMSIKSADAAQSVRDRVANIEAGLPKSADKPQVLRFDPSELPVMSLAISSDRLSARELTLLADNMLVKRLSNIEGVGRATILGEVKRQLNIDINPDRLAAFNVAASDVIAALQQNSQNIPAGAITGTRLVQPVQVDGRQKSIEDFLDTIVARVGDRPVTLGEVAEIRDAQQDEQSLALINGKKGLAIDIIKTQGANTVGVAREIHKVLARIEAGLPEGVTITVVRDNAVPVEKSFHAVINMLIEGALLATVIVFLFLNSWRSTIITGLTLPISIIGTMTVLYALGFTLNMMTLMALSLSVGILIDDAIVVRENIMRHLHMGKSHKRAALDGTNEIGLAVLATTLSIVAVFLPVAFMDGIMGRFFLQFGVTVSVAVMISLFVAFTLDPMMSSVWYDPAAHPGARRGPVGKAVAGFDRLFERITLSYRSVLRWCLKFRKTTLGIALASFIASFFLFPLVGLEFSPQTDNSEFNVALTAPLGSSLGATAAKVRQVETTLRTLPEVTRTYSTIGGNEETGSASGSILVSLVPRTERGLSVQEVAAEARKRLAAIPGADITISSGEGLSGGAPVQIFIYGDNVDTLRNLSDQLVRRLAATPGLADVTSSLKSSQPVLGVTLDADIASDRGVSLQQVGSALRPLLSGEKVAEWTAGDGQSYEVVLRLPPELRDDARLLADLPIARSMAGNTLVRLDEVARIEESTAPGQVKRRDLARQVTVTANFDGGGFDTVGPALQQAVAELQARLPTGYRVSLGGESEDLGDATGSALSALILAVVFIYLVLASQFGSFLQPIAIMISLPLALVGVMLGLLVGGSTLNIMSMIGFIMLMGLVVKNAILLVDNANQQRRAGTNLYDALVEAGATRFRPIVMTSLAMIFGMLPMALSLHDGSQENAPMAHAVIGGLISSTLLTLVVVPVILTYIDQFARLAARILPKAPHDDDEVTAPAE